MTGRILITAAAVLAAAGNVSAQTVIRAPFVRVETGGPGGTYVRAPFVNIWSPPGPPPIFIGPPVVVPPPPLGVQPFPVEPHTAQLPPPRVVPQPLPPGPAIPNGEPPLNPDLAPPAAVDAAKAPSLQDFARTFKPKGGNYEVAIANPITGRAETVRFSLPEGEPRNVRTNRHSIEFVYGPRQFVRIEFDRDGPMVTSR